MPAQIGSVMLALALLWRHYHELAEGPVSIARNLLAAVICGVLVFVLWINLDLPLLSLGQPRPAHRSTSPASSTGPGWW